MIAAMSEQRRGPGRPKKAGTYYKARLDDATRTRIKEWAKANHLPVAEALAVLATTALDGLEPTSGPDDELEGAA